MRTSLLLAACGLFLLGIAEAAQAVKAKRSTYNDAAHGFSFEAPRFPAAAPGLRVIPIIVNGPAEGGFASNVNVVIEAAATTRKAFRDQSIEQFKQVGLTLRGERNLIVSGRDALWLDYTGTLQGRDLHFLALAIIDKERVVLFTCTAKAEAFQAIEPEFRACLESVELGAR